MGRARVKIDLDDLFGPDGTLLGWYFAVPRAFLDALDIKYVQRRKDKKQWMEWTRPESPAYAFELGDVFYDVSTYGRGAWSEASAGVTWCVQVTEAISSDADGGEGDVNFLLTRYEDGRRGDPWASPKVSQTEFAELLRTGCLPGVLDLTEANG